MPLIVNTNIASITAQRSLVGTGRSLTKSLERLSTGLRINHSGDDAAGLAIATGMQTQVRGLTQAVRNVGDAQSAIGTADGAVNTQTEILQRIRELAVQAASDLYSGSNRKAIQQEISSQIEELTRVANTTTFNGLALIDGTFSNKQIQVGAMAGQYIEVSVGDFRATGMGSYAEKAGVAGVLTANASYVVGDVKINSIDVGLSTDDGVSSVLGEWSAISKASAINAIQSQTGVTAEVSAAVLSGAGNVAAATLAATDTLSINGVAIYTSDDAGTTFAVTGAELVAAINAQSTQTGVTATASTGGTLDLTAADGRNIIVEAAGASMATGSGFAIGNGLTLGSSAAHQATGQITLYSTEDIAVIAATVDDIGITSGTYTVDASKLVSTIDVTQTNGADNAIRIIDSALSDVADAVSELGALANRLENTIDNLNVSIENLTAAESRIRDADFAIETANLTRAQILQQSGVAILAQANLMPQAALSLLG
jgi:flagellin